MTKIFIKKQKSGLFYGEGAKDRKFLEALISYDKFQHHTKSWHFNCDNASGSDPKVILDQCRRAVSGVEYDIVLCFIDLDKLKKEKPKTWQMEKEKLEKAYPLFTIIWQLDNAEDEYSKIVGNEKNKDKLNKLAIKKIDKFVNKDFWNRVLTPIKTKDSEISSTNV